MSRPSEKSRGSERAGKTTRNTSERSHSSHHRRLGFTFRELVRETVADLRQNKLRSFLTMLGIAWGVASLIILVGAGEGMRVAHMKKMEALGKNIIIVRGGNTSLAGPGIRPGKRIFLTWNDYVMLKKNAYRLQRVSPEIERYDLVSVTPINRGNFDVSGVLVDFMAMRSIIVREGRPLMAKDIDDSARVCVIGNEVADQLFGDRARTGNVIRIGGLDFRVVGIMPDKEQNGNYSGPDNRKIFVPYTTMRRDFPLVGGPDGDRQLSDIIAQAPSVEEGESAEFQIRQILAREHLFDPRDEDALGIWNTSIEAKFITQIFSSIQLFLGFVAMVTLLLGGIGVMNIMLVSVRERTREIGLRKALGATRLNILALFFFEALLIAMGSGLIGYAGAMGLGAVINSLPLPSIFAGLIVSRWVGLAAFGFLLFVSLASAFYPSYSAAFLDPVEALRFEE